MYVAELKLTLIQPKMQLFEQTATREDYYKVKKILHDIEKEIDEIIYNEELNAKKMGKINKEIQEIKEEISEIE